MGFLADYPRLLGGFLADYQQAGVSVDRLLGVMDGAPAAALAARTSLSLRGPLPVAHPPVRAREPLALVEARGLSVRHPESGRGIEDVDLCLPRGTLTVVTGRLGAGKTTLLQALLGLLPPEAGEIRWNGDAVGYPSNFFVPPRAAYTPQVPHLFSQTLEENILLGLQVDPAILAAALHDSVLERDVTTLEDGLRTEVGTRGVKLSGGQIQRTAAARMLVRAAELLVIDDLSSALDVETERLLWRHLLARPGDARRPKL